MNAPVLLGPNGLPLPARRRSMASIGNGGSYDAASQTSQEMTGWMPSYRSADADVNPSRRDMVSRIRDLARNDGWASGSITRIVDSAVGADLRPAPKPDFRSLAWYSPAFDATWAAEFTSWAKGCWRDWAQDPACWCDAARQSTTGEQFQLSFRTMLTEGDAVATLPWRPERMAYGRGHYATTVALVEPDRLCNPNDMEDDATHRGGVEIDADGAAVRYHFRDGHPGDWYAGASGFTWSSYARETAWGRPVVVHYFEQDRIGQHRGVGVLAPVLSRMRMLSRYDSVELQAAVVNAILAAYIESPFDSDLVRDSLSTEAELSGYQAERSKFHEDRRLSFNGVRLPTLFPGEKINTVAANRPSGNYPAFQAAILRNIAAATGQSEMQVSQDWSRTNYSSARAALLETWKTITRRRSGFARGFAQPVWVAFLEEAMERDGPPMPNGAPDFAEMRGAYARCDWRGPGRGWVDPVKEPTGSQLRMEMGVSTLEHEASENAGMDYEDVLDQRAIEVAAFKSRGLPLPSWAGAVAAAAVQAPANDSPQAGDAT
ncbi:phage portal protein [Neoroseomonas lacus]|uniref:Phage portal protein n=1 Tax=Neoroseomonas lacus TaxID=287609 RepID=A0A917NQ05_9PROT|nr:phage portal protein [Neoroseomonas lacus]GGJ14120.1 phage portal protein [Neoroseomonas lacus]